MTYKIGEQVKCMEKVKWEERKKRGEIKDMESVNKNELLRDSEKISN